MEALTLTSDGAKIRMERREGPCGTKDSKEAEWDLRPRVPGLTPSKSPFFSIDSTPFSDDKAASAAAAKERPGQLPAAHRLSVAYRTALLCLAFLLVPRCLCGILGCLGFSRVQPPAARSCLLLLLRCFHLLLRSSDLCPVSLLAHSVFCCNAHGAHTYCGKSQQFTE